MTWLNSDGLFIRFGNEMAVNGRGGDLPAETDHFIEFDLNYTDALSATYTIVNDAAGGNGILVPKKARIKYVEFTVLTPFTSSGTIGSSVLSLGLKRASDRSTEIDHDGFTTVAFVGSVLDAAGEYTRVVPGVTGAGAKIGADSDATYPGLVVVANTAHATHPFTAGKVRVRICHTFLANT